ncbi:MAG: 2Fe-2S ferredoxin [Pseudomonadota bacterium]|jgi:ferredoxin
MHRVVVDGVGVEVPSGVTLLEACDSHGLPMETACGGFAACNSCRVRVVSGVLSDVDPAETPFLDRPEHRLGCQARVVGDVVVVLDPGT